MSRDSRPEIAVQVLVLLLALGPAAGFVAGLLTPPGPARDPIAVSTVLLLFFGLPGGVFAAALTHWLVPRSRPILRRVLVASCFSFGATLCVADFWFIGIGAGLKARSARLWSIPIIVLVTLTVSQCPRLGFNDQTGTAVEPETDADA